MKSEVPAYIIKYIECSEPHHEGEKVNLICLNQACADNSLICSICSSDKHKGHQFKPLKIYLDELYRRYRGSEDHHSEELEQLEKRKMMLLMFLRNCVERISEQFCRLEENIIFTYENLKTQIQENEAKRSRFEEFYLSMIKDNYGDPHFQVKNYLFKEEIQILTDQDIFQDLTNRVTQQINDIKGLFLTKAHIESSPPPDVVIPKTAFFLPPQILCDTDVFTQTNHTPNAKNLCLFDVEVSKWTNKLRVTILGFTAGSKLTLGLMKREQFKKANFVFNDTLNCIYLNSIGKSKGSQSNYIANLGLNTIIDFFIKKNNLRATCKNNNSIFNLNDKDACFFFVLEGNTKIKITYPYVK